MCLLHEENALHYKVGVPEADHPILENTIKVEHWKQGCCWTFCVRNAPVRGWTGGVPPNRSAVFLANAEPLRFEEVRKLRDAMDAEGFGGSTREKQAHLAMEEHTTDSEAGRAFAETLVKHAPARMRIVGTQDSFGEFGDWSKLLREQRLWVEHIGAETIQFLTGEPR